MSKKGQTNLGSSKHHITKRQRDKLLSDVGKIATKEIALQLLRSGAISTIGKSDEALEEEINQAIKNIVRSKLDIQIVIDHTDSLLREARKFFRADSMETSALFYATYFEHRLNGLITLLAQSKGIGQKAILSVLRETNTRAKCSWVLELLGHSPINSKNTKSIVEISEIRNAFVHYKWPEAPDDHNDKLRAKVERAEIVVRYLRKFENVKIYKGERNRVQRLLRQRKKVNPSDDAKSN